jgi:hypothetical protein
MEEQIKTSKILRFNADESGNITEIGYFENYEHEVPEDVEIGFNNFLDYQFIDGQLVLKNTTEE